MEGSSNMKRTDAALLGAVWRHWANGRPLSYGRVSTIFGYNSNGSYFQRLQRLRKAGWLSMAARANGHSLRPGPRFAGWDRKQGKPLEVIE